jgi:putative ABC transport system substrate-binding protein
MTRVAPIIDDVISQKPDVLVGWESVAQVMRSKTTSIPIVLADAVDPIGAGLVQSLRRPGTNVTGVVQLNDVLPAKHIEIIREIRPRLARVGQFVDTTASGCKLVEKQSRRAAESLGAVMVPYYLERTATWDSADELCAHQRARWSLFAYATSLHDTYQRAAIYVAKILNGAKA